MRRVVFIVVVVLIIGVVIAWVLPSGYNNYTVRSRLVEAILAIEHGRSNLESGCTNGTFASKHKTTDIGVSESDPKAYISRAELLRVTPNDVRLKVTLMDIYGQPFFLLFPRKAIPQGSVLEFEYSCSAEKKFSSRFIGSTVEQEYLPPHLRNI